MKVVVSPDADADLRDIFDYVARDNPARAATFAEEVLQAALSIAEFPLAWPLIPRFEAKGYRRRLHKGYIIFFEMSAEQVTVLRILNGMQDYERILFPQDRNP